MWVGVLGWGVAWTFAWISPTRSALAFNLGIAMLVLALFEANAQRKPDFHFVGEHAGKYSIPDETLGYLPAFTGPLRVTKYFGDALVFDVVYTLDEHGLRASAAPDGGTPPEACVLFFGGSYTYGEGVADHETLPSRLAKRAGARSFNFGFKGYGPHQMLAALESGRVERAIDCRPTHAIYQAIVDHVNRAVGLAYWDRHGPRYRLAEGAAIRDGHFDDETSAFERVVWDQLQKSLIVRRVSQRRRAVTADDMALFHAIVDTARKRLEREYPGIGFHVIVWDQSGAPSPLFWEGLERRGIPVHKMSRILPEQHDGDPRFELGPYDRHPNGAVYDAMARYVAQRILTGGAL